MKNIETIKPTHKLSAPKQVKTKRDLTYSKDPTTACVIPAGTALTVYFSETHPAFIYFDYNGSLRRLLCQNAFNNITGVDKCPSIHTMGRWELDGVAKTVTGDRTEPDGYGPDGAPSWLISLGII